MLKGAGFHGRPDRQFAFPRDCLPILVDKRFRSFNCLGGDHEWRLGWVMRAWYRGSAKQSPLYRVSSCLPILVDDSGHGGADGSKTHTVGPLVWRMGSRTIGLLNLSNIPMQCYEVLVVSQDSAFRPALLCCPLRLGMGTVPPPAKVRSTLPAT